MKNAAFFALTAVSVIIAVSCNRNDPAQPTPSNPSSPQTPADTTAPVITISGGNYQTQMEPAVPGSGTFTAPTATAIDDVDGDISDSIVITGTVDPNTVGIDTLYYSVSDSAGNMNTDTLIVEITPYGLHDAPYLAGTYNGNDTCTISGTYTYTSMWSLSTSVSNEIAVQNFGAFGNSVTVEGTVNATQQTVSFPAQALFSTASIVSASGSYTYSGNSVNVVINFVWSDGTSSESCVAHYIK
jgi:hypothetical protein